MIKEHSGEYFTKNLVPGKAVYGEELRSFDGVEYRHWNPHRSKLSAYLKLGGNLQIKEDSDILYLGAGQGTTVSHLSDMAASGRIFAVEVSPTAYRKLLSLSQKRPNIFPILADARHPGNYNDIVDKVDFLYQDIAQRDQSNIFLKNIGVLKKGALGMIAVKARSIDISKEPTKIYQEVKRELKENGLDVKEPIVISRWQKDHALIPVSF